ncbi:MAG: hypothetical protein ACRD59_03750 [Candidatus Acidiferrales bacterium]
MRIADRLLKCVGFVSRYEPDDEGGSRLRFGGTAFIVGVLMDGNIGLAHLVTARHVVEAIEPGETVITMNAKDGMSLSLRTGNQKWFYHPTEKDSVDVAVMPFGSARFNEYDIEWIPEGMFATDQRIADFEIGLGDELFIIGLFTRFFGRTKLTPIVRTGNIAMMPEDKVAVEGFGDMEAYLAEGRSIGGLSGSPAFVRNTVKIPMQIAGGKLTAISGLGNSHLLGLVHGHWRIQPPFTASQAEAVNMGVSIIVPAKKILETLYNPELVAMRQEHWNNQSNPLRVNKMICKEEDANMDRKNLLPTQDFDGMTSEVWHTLNVCLYHTAYVRVYANTGANRLFGSKRTQTAIQPLSQAERDMLQEDALVFRAHFASVLWQLHHLAELLCTAYRRCKQEGIVTNERYDELVKALNDDPIINEIHEYRNMSHQFAGVYIALHDSNDAFIAHVLPPLDAKSPEQRAPLDETEIGKAVQERELNMKLEAYCNHLGGYCEGLFKTIDAKYKMTVIPRSHGFAVTVPHSYKGELPELPQAIYIKAVGSSSTE